LALTTDKQRFGKMAPNSHPTAPRGLFFGKVVPSSETQSLSETPLPFNPFNANIDNGAGFGYHLPHAVPREARRAQKWRKPFAA
jgi:hypothetical protein